VGAEGGIAWCGSTLWCGWTWAEGLDSDTWVLMLFPFGIRKKRRLGWVVAEHGGMGDGDVC